MRVGRNDAAEPDWTHFGKSVAGRFAQVGVNGFATAVGALEATSPRRQVARNGQLKWEPVVRQPGDSREELILRLVKTTRNNLFHGGKYPDGSVAEVARDKAILVAALTVLDLRAVANCIRVLRAGRKLRPNFAPELSRLLSMVTCRARRAAQPTASATLKRD